MDIVFKEFLLTDSFYLFNYNSEELVQSTPLVTFVKLLIVDKGLPHPFDLHNCTAKLEEQESIEN